MAGYLQKGCLSDINTRGSKSVHPGAQFYNIDLCWVCEDGPARVRTERSKKISMGFPILQTARLHLREILDSDVQVLFVIYGNADAMKFFGLDPITKIEDAQKLVEIFRSWRSLPNPGVRWGIEHSEDKKLIGTCGLFKWNRNWKSCTIGYELAPEYWGKGFMSEALQVALKYGFGEMQLNRIEAQIHPQNSASIQLAERLGFKNEGLMREAGFCFGQHHDLLMFSLLKGDLNEYRN